ncbi:MAG TPA: chromosome segregation protein SMC [Gemmatimonadaceae bacterium]|nr:chromosome segregation protein SMC [Gemmatimonadaceae bacterium]
MRLTKLELQGFKSFADSTDMVFNPGVTAIVGPNGCGKSNVSDAVRWVLGEQRARLLRGAKMEEVIFQGSSARRAVNVAEVSLHFSNEDGALPIAFQEVVITRRLSRSGESEYFLNRAPCRLRDIADLLRGTGLGADTGVVIESKMIDALLSDRPDDRRELFEEAAGVGLYRDRRRTTERRLEETTVDLQRLDDLISEVQSQVRSLARQRKRAERYSELMGRRFTIEIALAKREMVAWHDELNRLDERVRQLRETAPQTEQAVANAEQGRDAAHGNRAAAEAQRTELLRLVSSQRERVQQIRSEMAVAEERQRNALARRQRAELEANEGEAYGVRISTDREQAAAERTQVEEQLRAAQEALSDRQRHEDDTRQSVGHARTALDEAERHLRELQDRSRRVEIDRERARHESDELSQRFEQLTQEREQLGDALTAIDRELETAAVAVEQARSRAADAATMLEAVRTADRETRDREAAARADLFRADEAHTSLQGKVNALDTLERERVGLAPAAARLLRERDQFGEGAVLGPLSDFISADQNSALLVERFLGATVHAVLVRDRAATDAVRAWHATANPGPLLLLPLDAAQDAQGGEITEDALSHRVDATGPGRAWVRALLGHAHSVDDGSAFTDARGAVWLPGTTAGPGPLRRRAELFALRAELIATDNARQQAMAAADTLRTAVQESERKLIDASATLESAQVDARRAAEQQGELARRRQRSEREVADADALAERLSARRDQLVEQLRRLDDESRTLADSLSARTDAAAEARAQLSVAERGHEEAREARTTAQVHEAQAHARVQVAHDRERRLAEELQSAAARLASLKAELTDLSQADSALAEQMGTWQFDLETREATLADGEARLEGAEAAVLAADEALTTAEHALDDARRRAQAHNDELHQAELRHTELGGRRAAIRERLEAEWRRPLDDMLAEAQAIDMDDDALRTEAEALRQELERLGPVNVLAIEEHEETLKRQDFLTGQRADLSDAKQSLLQAIREIDSTARELFLATFAQVRENFRQIFMSLFGGGECDLRLENPDAPLDCDIEIHASPRGKRTQRIHLLSSGERALVALSLLFGIFLTKPSPFCLLDEVDAPLDDANVGRFVRMLTQFKTRTQFIVITHNPRTTTEAADAVYGVTMQEPGVSSLVSVRMRGAPSVDEELAVAAIGGAVPTTV